MRAALVAASAAIALFATSCSDDLRAVGEPCDDDFNCSSGLCAGGDHDPFRERVCVTRCSLVLLECPDGFVCVPHRGGACFAPCVTDADCGQEGLVCRELEGHAVCGPF